MSATEFPVGWKFCGVQQSKDQRLTGMQVVEARKLFERDPGTAAEIIIQAHTREKLLLLASDYETWMDRSHQKSQMMISIQELTHLLEENTHLQKQVTELQSHGTLKEEHLRAYRRVTYSPEQFDKLKRDLEETTARVLKSYGQQPAHEILLPRVANGA